MRQLASKPVCHWSFPCGISTFVKPFPSLGGVASSLRSITYNRKDCILLQSLILFGFVVSIPSCSHCEENYSSSGHMENCLQRGTMLSSK